MRSAASFAWERWGAVGDCRSDATLKSDLRWCSDGFEIRCWNGERVQVAFSLDCCDREVIAYQSSAEYPTALARVAAETARG